MTLKFHIIRDYRNFFYSSTKPPDSSVKLDLLAAHLEAAGATCQVWDFRNIDLSADWDGELVVYQSCEDRGLLYKDYSEDVILALEMRGAVLIPDFWAFRCHHNKAIQELVRDLYLPDSRIKSRVFGCFEDLEKEISSVVYPCVLKSAAGAKSTGVSLCKNERDLRKKARRISASIDPVEWLKDRVKRVVRPEYVPVSQHKRKFLIQTFLPGLGGDFRVTVIGERAFAMQRFVRPNDFRASGSGRRTLDDPVPEVLLDYAFDLRRRFDVPYCSLDIVMYDGKPDLIEFQFMTFGTSTVNQSNRHFVETADGIREIKESVELEKALADAMVFYVKQKGTTVGLPRAANQ